MQRNNDTKKPAPSLEFNWQVSVPDTAREYKDPLAFGWWLFESAVHPAKRRGGVQTISMVRYDRQIDFHTRVWGIDFEGSVKVIAMNTGCVLLFMGKYSSQAGFVLSHNIGIQVRQIGLDRFHKERERFLELIGDKVG